MAPEVHEPVPEVPHLRILAARLRRGRVHQHLEEHRERRRPGRGSGRERVDERGETALRIQHRSPVGGAVTLSGGAAGPNLTAWAVMQVLFEGKMRTIFSMLFGAGLMLTSFVRLEAVDPGYRVDEIVVVGVPLPQARYDAAGIRAIRPSSAAIARRSAPACRSEGRVRENEFVGIFPVSARMLPRRKALGYREIELVTDSCVAPRGAVARGHEFHYSEMEEMPESVERVYRVRKNGKNLGTEGYRYKNCLASYIHIHFGSCPEMAKKFVKSCEKYKHR